MDFALVLLLLVIVTALVFEFINGFHDTANSIATVVATKVLTPTQAVMLAAVTNLIGAFWGTAVAKTIASGLIDTDVVTVTSQVLICALAGGITWNLITWWLGLPSSSSHALIGGLCGAALSASNFNWHALIWAQSSGEGWTHNKGLLWKVVVPMVSSPIAGFLLGIVVMCLLWAIIAGMARMGGVLRRMARPRWVNAFFGKAQIVSAAYMGFAHGHNDAQKTMGIIAALLIGANKLSPEILDDPEGIPMWIVLSCHAAIGLGTMFGGWKIVKTMGTKLTKLEPMGGVCAESAAAATLFFASINGIPVSTTHTITGAIVGTGSANRLSAVRWNVAGRVLWAWVLTIPGSAVVAMLSYWIVEAFN